MPIPADNNLPDPTPDDDHEANPDTPPSAPPGPDDSEETKPTGVEKFIDEIVRGEYM